MKRLALLLLLALGLSGCAYLTDMARTGRLRAPTAGEVVTAAKEDAPDVVEAAQDVTYDARKEMTAEAEYYFGRSVAATILDRAGLQYRDRASFEQGRLAGLSEYLAHVGALLAAQAEEAKLESDDRPAPMAGWHFIALESEEANAFSAPGGFVFVTTGALKLMRSEDELAAVLAHEVAHIRRGHGFDAVNRSRKIGGVLKLVKKGAAKLTPAEISGLADDMHEMAGEYTKSLIDNGYSRDAEYESDAVGARLLAGAGYDAEAMARYLEAQGKLAASGGWNKSHPVSADRVGALRKVIAKLAKAKPAPPARAKRWAAAKLIK